MGQLHRPPAAAGSAVRRHRHEGHVTILRGREQPHFLEVGVGLRGAARELTVGRERSGAASRSPRKSTVPGSSFHESERRYISEVGGATKKISCFPRQCSDPAMCD